MMMSRAEIAAAEAAWRASPLPSIQWDSDAGEASAPDVPPEFVARCAAIVCAEPFYRLERVVALAAKIAEQAYAAPADAIVDQLLGRLLAANLRG